jgi:hypothetical protein
MEELVSHFVKRPLSGEDLLKLVDGKAALYTNNELKRFDTINQALGRHKALFILYEKEKNTGHWVVVFRNGDTVEYFDPYGYRIDYPITKFGGYPHLSEMLSDHVKKGGTVMYNKERLQKLSKDISSCGRHCALRLILRDMPLDKYQRLFRDKGDMYVTLMTMFAD